MNEYLAIFLLAMTPVGELRASIPVAVGIYKMHWLTSYVISISGNMIPPILILFFLRNIVELSLKRKGKFAKKLKEFLEKQGKKSRLVRTYGIIGLIAFVAIPLPATGAWTGAFIAFLMNMPRVTALSSIFFGVCIAGVITTLASLGIIHIAI